MEQMRLTIITPSYNRAGMIADAVESVCAQKGVDFEHIIVDGSSSDNTLEVLKRYPHLQVISEPDRGMYDAINKGIARASGDLIAWLNSDDLYPPGAFAAVLDAFASHPDALVVSGGAETFLEEGGVERLVKSELGVGDEGFWRRIVESPSPNGWFFKRSLFEQVGLFDPSFRLVADRQFLIRVALAGIRPVPVEQVLYRYRMHSGSATFQPEDSRHVVYGPRRMDVNQEDLRMLAGFLVRPDLPAEVRGVMKRANGEYAYRLTATAVYHRRWALAWKGVCAGLRWDPFFLLAFARFSLRRVFHVSGHG